MSKYTERANKRFSGAKEKSLKYESINDRNIFKAVILAGGPGSGKSFVSGAIFSGSGVRVLNSDDFFEFLLNKFEVTTKIDPNKPEIFAKQMKYRDKAKQLANSRSFNAIDGMLPLVVDGTGKNFDKISRQKKSLENLGYDVSLVFVNTSIEVAKARNLERPRSVPEDVVVKSWKAVQNNIGKFQSLFKQNFFIIDNNEVLDGPARRNFDLKMAKLGLKILNSPIKNPIGKKLKSIFMSSNGKLKMLSDYLDPEEIKFSV